MKSQFHQYDLAFIKYLKANGLVDKTNLLILDGHKSHLYNLPFYEAMRPSIIVLADVHRENVDEGGTSMYFQVTQYNQM